MTGYTHFLGGLAILALPVGLSVALGTPVPLETVGMLAAGAALGGLAPDLDASQSLIKHLTISVDVGISKNWKANTHIWKPFEKTADVLSQTLGHRTLLHSLWGVVLFAVLVGGPLVYYGYLIVAAGFLLGYVSHLMLDACTVSGIPLLYPARQKFHLLPKFLRVVTGSEEEGLVFVLVAVIAFGALLPTMR